MDPQEIFLQRIIGEGTFGRVWSARWKSSSVAVKEFVFAQAAVIGRSSMQQQIVEEIIGEAGIMAILRHPNVLQLFGCSLTAQAIWIVSELCSLGSLRQVLDDRERALPDDLRVNLALQVAEGMSYLHNQDPAIIHRDLKPQNCLLDQAGTLKVGDVFTAGAAWGKCRALQDEFGNSLEEAGPSTPVRLVGWTTGADRAPRAGDALSVVPDEPTARKLADARNELESATLRREPRRRRRRPP